MLPACCCGETLPGGGLMCSSALRRYSETSPTVYYKGSNSTHMVVLRIRNVHKRKYALICLCIIGFIIYQYKSLPAKRWRMSRKVGLSANTSQFTLEGETFRIIGGSVHYFRVPRAYWRDRLLKMKACGINTLTTYVPWSLHQPEDGVFNFHTQLDLEAYINLAAEIGLWVILRPGPYISAELDLGGLPSWLLRDSRMRLRTTYPGFTQAVNTYFNKLIPKVVPLQFKNGGPIIAVQVENEYGSFAKDQGYMLFIKEALMSRGISELLITSDFHSTLKFGGVDGAIRSVKLQKLNQRDVQELTALQPNSPSLVMEYWPGGFDVWGDLHHVLPPEDMVSTMREILRRGMSVNMYMFHGGSSFGFLSGALADPSYRALVPSYDYDAPLSEAGEYTPKYHLLRDLLSRYSMEGDSLPDPPALHYRETYEPAIMYQHLPLWDALSFAEGPFKSPKPLNMENLPANNGNGQSYGYTLYDTSISSGGVLKSCDHVRDRALVFVDRRYIGLLKRQNQELAVPDGEGQRTLSLLVENCGRVHRGRHLDKQQKGLVGDVLLNDIPLRDFTIYSLDMKPSFIDSLYQAPWKSLPENPTFPGFFMGRLFAYGYPSDTFVKLPGWEKGVVFINGLNLGRYWSIGPQQALYLPGPFLNSGINQVLVFEEQEGDYRVQFEDTADLGMAAEIQ
ncbi:beta-galactosidase-1-like protein 2 [Nothobranchius furzeri]|uniref:Beta-galactosidase n=2 Tax=Nothobranchius furzeri TaxID=105023 RepID=A0A1A7ZF93_NOTFU|nr:beta-galactosidase-1-like protein 2 isoform X1 [Nothobranchius furzeri]KAF7205261.1 beta-galactosidase-1-like protein 2 [Nothobranchius furzeri]